MPARAPTWTLLRSSSLRQRQLTARQGRSGATSMRQDIPAHGRVCVEAGLSTVIAPNVVTPQCTCDLRSRPLCCSATARQCEQSPRARTHVDELSDS